MGKDILAFPHFKVDYFTTVTSDTGYVQEYREVPHYSYGDGMTLRDYMAGQALISMSAQYNEFDSNDLARRCYLIADAMIKERKKYDDNQD